MIRLKVFTGRLQLRTNPEIVGKLYKSSPEGLSPRAGEPDDWKSGALHSGVYPRACGGTTLGLGLWGAKRAYPAPAGEPRWAKAWTRIQQVYPRVCGGTTYSDAALQVNAGLSPRVRGNRCHALRQPPSDGVYPRAGGGTLQASASPISSWGLSPRVRGNPEDGTGRGTLIGSIPACAGEPSANHLRPRNQKGLSPRLRGNLRWRIRPR